MSSPNLIQKNKTSGLKCLILNFVLVSGKSPDLADIQGPLRAIQDPLPHGDRPYVEKGKDVIAKILSTLISTWIILTESVCMRP